MRQSGWNGHSQEPRQDAQRCCGWQRHSGVLGSGAAGLAFYHPGRRGSPRAASDDPGSGLQWLVSCSAGLAVRVSRPPPHLFFGSACRAATDRKPVQVRPSVANTRRKPSLQQRSADSGNFRSRRRGTQTFRGSSWANAGPTRHVDVCLSPQYSCNPRHGLLTGLSLNRQTRPACNLPSTDASPTCCPSELGTLKEESHKSACLATCHGGRGDWTGQLQGLNAQSNATRKSDIPKSTFLTRDRSPGFQISVCF